MTILAINTYRFLIQLTYEVLIAALMKTFTCSEDSFFVLSSLNVIKDRFLTELLLLLILQIIASYFPLPQCIEGLKILVESLFGVTFHRVPLAPGESWHPDVLKIVLHHPTEASLTF